MRERFAIPFPFHSRPHWQLQENNSVGMRKARKPTSPPKAASPWQLRSSTTASAYSSPSDVRLSKASLALVDTSCLGYSRLVQIRYLPSTPRLFVNLPVACLSYSPAASSSEISCLPTLLGVMTCSGLQSRYVCQQGRDLHCVPPHWETWSRLGVHQADWLFASSEFAVV